MEDFMAPGSVARCIAKSEIETLFNHYAMLANETPVIENLSSVFKKDGIFRLPNGVEVKPAELLKVTQGNNPDFIRHHITTIDIEFVSPTKAHTRSYFFATTHMSSFDHWGIWKDVVTRDGSGKWLIAERSVIVEGGDEKGWYKNTYPS